MSARLKKAAITAAATTLLAAGAVAAAPSSGAMQAPPEGGGCSSYYVVDSKGDYPDSRGDQFGTDVTLVNCSSHTYVVNVFVYSNPTSISTSLFTTRTIKAYGSSKVSIPFYKAYHYSDWYKA